MSSLKDSFLKLVSQKEGSSCSSVNPFEAKQKSIRNEKEGNWKGRAEDAKKTKDSLRDYIMATV